MTLRALFGHGWLALASGIVFIISQGLVGSVLESGGASTLLFSFQFTYDPDTFSALLASISPEQLLALQGHYTYDHLHPLWYGLFIVSFTAWLLKINNMAPRWDILIATGVIPSVLDVIENHIHEPVFNGLVAADDAAIALAGICATVKWLMAALYLIFAIVLIVRFRKSRRN